MGAYTIYTRQSRVRHDVTLSSCDVQFQICRDYADAVLPRGIAWCGTRYDDPGQSGENLDRPALQALLAEIEKGSLSHVIVYRLQCRQHRKSRYSDENSDQPHIQRIGLLNPRGRGVQPQSARLPGLTNRQHLLLYAY